MFALDTAKIGDTVKHQEFAKLRFDFWKRVIQQIFNVTAQDPSQKSQPNSMFSGALTQEPIAILLIHALSTQNIQLSKRYFITYLQSRETYSRMPPFRNLDAMASYGEGLNSQLLYLLQEALYSVAPKVSAFLAEYPEVDKIAHDIVAHIGQASGIAALLKGSIYYAQRGSLVFPIDVMAKYDLSQSDVNDLFEAHFAKQAQEGSNDEKINQLRTKLSDVVFETATRANDHLLSATSLLNQLKTALEGDVPDALIVPALSALPAKLYLEDLEAYNFDILNPKLLAPSRASKLFGVVGDWKLPYRSYKAYKNKSLD